MKFNFTFMRCMAMLLACFTAFSSQAQSDATVTITAPMSVAGDYAARQAAFGPGLTADLTGTIVEGVDTSGATTVCDSIATDLTGVIALVDRGACAFVTKVVNAQAKGATGVIVCNNNTAAPNSAIVMGGDDMGAVTIPSVMLSYNQCQTIRAELGNGLAGTFTTSTLIPSDPGTVCADPTVLTAAGFYTATLDSGYGGVFGGTGNGAWYSYTPTENTLITVTSCDTAASDTRLIVLNNCTDLGVLAFNDDCDGANGNFASEATWLGVAGTEYLILWDDRWSGAAFDWELILAAPPIVDVTVTVDMGNEATTSMDNGAHIAGNFNGWSSTPMTDNGDSTYSFTITGLTAGDSIEYKFQNGNNINWEEFADGDLCTVTDPSGQFVNRLLIPGIASGALDPVCFNSCGACVPVATCEEPIFLIGDDLESYAEGDIGSEGPWRPWPGAGVTGLVSTEQAFSGTQSLLIDGVDPTLDALYVLNAEEDLIEGHYWVTWKMYIPAGFGAYWNIQHAFPDNPNWAIDAFYDGDGTGRINLNDGGDQIPFTYAEDAWFDVVILVDIDNDEARLIQGDLTVTAAVNAAWTFSNASGGASNALNSINFYPLPNGAAPNKYYVDDVALAVIPTPVAGDGQYCYTANAIEPGTHTASELSCFGAGYFINDSGLSGEWFTYTPTEDGYISISSCGGGADTRGWIFEGDCHSLSTLGVNDDMCDLGNGSQWASYREAAVTAGNTYYILWDDMWETTGFEFDLAFTAGDLPAGEFCESAITAEVNMDMLIESFGDAAVAGPNVGNFIASTTPYTQSTWYTWTPDAADTVDITSCAAGTDTRVWVYTGSCGSFDDLTLIASSDNDCGSSSLIEDWVPTAGTTYYIEWDNEESSEAFIWRIEKEIIIDVDEVELSNAVKVFPNPATDQLSVQFDLSEAVDMEVRLINTLGQVVNSRVLNAVQGETIQFNVSNLAKGTYFVQFITEGGSSSQKVILQE